jgi:hypothetical protein
MEVSPMWFSNFLVSRRFRWSWYGPLVKLVEGWRPWIRSCLLALAMVPAFTLQGFAGFIAAPAYDAGNVAYSVAVGDFNGDGLPDLAVVGRDDNNPTGTVSILLGNGDGTFQAPRVYPAGTGYTTWSVAVGDFNRDGHLDLAVANGGGGEGIDPCYVSVLLGNGDGTFQVAQNYATGSGSFAVAVGDFNEDGSLDLAVANNIDGTVSLLLGHGDGTFQAARNYAVGSGPLSIAVGDFNGDGHLDLAVAGGQVYYGDDKGSVSVLLGHGDGTFQDAHIDAISTGLRSVAVGDFNGDGTPDLAIASGDGTVSILLGKGDGTFQTTQTFNVASAAFLAVGDFDGDGRPDLAVAGSVLTILLGNGDGTFHSEQSYGGAYFALFGGPALVAADFNGDGHLDLALANPGFGGNGTVSILLANGDATLRAGRSYPTGSSTFSVAVGDFNGDGHLDLAVAKTFENTVSILLGNGDGSFQAAQTCAAGDGPLSLAVADFNGDGHLDLAVANQGTERDFTDGSVSILLGKGDGTFQATQRYTLGSSEVSVAVGDFNGDGHPDLAVGGFNRQGTVNVLLGNGDGTFQVAQSYAVGIYESTVAVGDFNGDGYLDLAVANEVTVALLLGKGDGTFRATQGYAAGGNPSYPTVGDFNGDGHLDLAVANDGCCSATVLLNKGDGSFQAAQSYPTWGSTSAVVADFNKDGRLDLAVAGPGSPVSIFLGNGDGTFQAAQGYLSGNNAWSLAVGDFNGDGFPDLAVTNGDGIVVLLNAANW